MTASAFELIEPVVKLVRDGTHSVLQLFDLLLHVGNAGGGQRRLTPLQVTREWVQVGAQLRTNSGQHEAQQIHMDQITAFPLVLELLPYPLSRSSLARS